jgi:hypothetical protein
MAIYEILPGENGECVCQGLLDFFMFIGGVPYLIVFDNANPDRQTNPDHERRMTANY